MAGAQNGPGCASSEPKRLRLLVEREESSVDESVPEFPYLRRLSRLHLCNDGARNRVALFVGRIIEQLQTSAEFAKHHQMPAIKTYGDIARLGCSCTKNPGCGVNEFATAETRLGLVRDIGHRHAR